jgi:DNA mismatch repair protein MutL
MKFIQSKTSEKNQLVKIIRSFLLANPQIEFSIKWDQNEKEIYQIKMLQERISDVLFKKRKSHFMHTQTQYDGVSFEIFLSQESSRGNAHKYHFLFINNRYIHDIQIHKIILNSAKHLWPELESGHYIAKLHIPSDEIDVNVHPNKIVVKLFQAPKIYSLISGTIKNKILSPLQTRSSHKEPLINKKIEEQNLFPTSESMIPTFKDIDYKKIDFEQESEVTNYLEHIHNKDQMFNGPTTQSYSHFKDFVIIVENSQVFLLNKSELIMSHLYKILTSSVEENEVIPLLVSRPLSLKKKLNVKQEIFIRSLGFDIDFLEEKTLVVRSFPKKLQSLPYLSLLDFIISTRSTNLKAISFKEYPLDEISNSLIENIYQKLTASEKNKKIVFPIEENDLKKLYEQKK